MGTTTTMTRTATTRRLFAGLAAGLAFLGLTEVAQAQEILLTGPLAGAPAVRKLRLHREGRFELAPAVSFTLLDEYQRTILAGARINYNITDWLALGVWGGYATGPLHQATALTEHIQEVNDTRHTANDPDDLDLTLTQENLGRNFEDQVGQINWVAAPQLTVIPFRGKIALFKSIYLDTDLYFFGGAAIVGLEERGNCQGAQCRTPQSFERVSRNAYAPTYGLGFTFYINSWSAIGTEWRQMPFAWNTGGFDTAGRGQNEQFPDGDIDDADRQFSLNNVISVSYNIYFPFEHRVSE